MRYKGSIFVIVVVAGLIAVCVYSAIRERTERYMSDTVDTSPAATRNAGLPMKTITLGSTTLEVEIASDDAEREQGLSGRTSLAEGRGMLFVFDPARQVGFWMKDMKFSIDMIFADEAGSIVKIDSNATPSSYTDHEPPLVFRSFVPVRYVLEVPAGYAQRQGIAIGQKIVVQ